MQTMYTKKSFITDVKAGDSIHDVYALSEKTIGHKKDGKKYLNITLSDKTGSLKGVVWEQVDLIINTVNTGGFVYAEGKVSEYNGALQLVVKTMRLQPVDSVDPTDFLPATPHNINHMFDRLKSITNAIKTTYLKNLLNAFWTDDDFADKFKTAPAAKKMHHAYLGGLLEHSLSMAILAEKVAGHYSGIDADLLLTGAILHDIGKIREFNYSLNIDYSDEGRLLNHIVIGTEMIDKKIKQIKDFPFEQALLLKHLIVSHHGTREFGSPEPPKTIEAFLLNYIDEIDSKINGIRTFMSLEDPNEKWTSYHRLLGRYFYKGVEK
jgi:3'-5' exoribonuclease